MKKQIEYHEKLIKELNLLIKQNKIPYQYSDDLLLSLKNNWLPMSKDLIKYLKKKYKL